MHRSFDPPAKRVREFAALAERLQNERQAAARDVDRLLRDTLPQNWSELAEHPLLTTLGGLEHLAALVTMAVTKDTRHALTLAELGVLVADRLQADSYPAVIIAQLRAHALKDLGKVQRELARHHQAIETFLRAEEILDAHLALHHDLALIRLHLGVTYQEVDRFNDAFMLIRESKAVFEEHGDTRMVLIAGIAEGALYQRLGRYREAREAYLLLLVRSKPDATSEAALRENVGLCCIELGDFPNAEANIAASIRLYARELGQPIEALKAQAAYGRLMIRMGQYARAIAHLKPIRRGFLGQGMAEEAGICALEIIEGYLALNKSEAAERLARMVTAEFTRARLNKRAISALGYLNRAIAAEKASVSMVRNVRDYILALRTNPEREFLRTTVTVSGQGSER